jgi:hypothetical protein
VAEAATYKGEQLMTMPISTLSARIRGEELKIDEQLKSAAFHEVGHAVVGFVLGFKPNKYGISIVPHGDSAGRMGHQQRGKRRPKDNLRVLMAGGLAQLGTGTSEINVFHGIGGDVKSAVFSVFDLRYPVVEPFAYMFSNTDVPVAWVKESKDAADSIVGTAQRHVYSLASPNEPYLFPPVEKGEAALLTLHVQFVFAMLVVIGASPLPDHVDGDPAVYAELKSAAEDALNILKDNVRLLHALQARLLRVKSMSDVELTAFLEGRGTRKRALGFGI